MGNKFFIGTWFSSQSYTKKQHKWIDNHPIGKAMQYHA